MPKQKQDSAAVDLLRRIVEKLRDQYDEAECPNGKPACQACRLMTEARKFVDAIPLAPAGECGMMRGDG